MRKCNTIKPPHRRKLFRIWKLMHRERFKQFEPRQRARG
jgi:hypothetical protein